MSVFVPFVLASVVLIAVPGPSVLFIVGRSIALGRRAGVLSVIGNGLGALPAIVAVAFGVGAVVAASAVAFTMIKLIGAAYLVWLGVQAIRHRHMVGQSTAVQAASSSVLLRQGFVVGVTNPKTMAFFVAVLPQFVDPAAGPTWLQLLVLGVVFQGIGLICDSVWALLAGSARDWFGRSPRRMAGMAGTGGVVLIGLGGALALSGTKQ